MKNMMLLPLFLTLIFITTNSFLHADAQLGPLVRDADGDLVRTGVEYYIGYPIGFGGGIGLPPGSGRICPAPVIQIQRETIRGLPVTFEPIRNRPSRVIRANTTELYIKFPGEVTGCSDRAGFWTLRYDESAEKAFVVAGSLVPNPSSHFRILQLGERDNSLYTFATCPPIAGLSCISIGTIRKGLFSHLVVNDQPNDVPLQVIFHKAPVGVIQMPK